MTKNIQAIRGMNDYLPSDIILWQSIENILKKVLSNYGYSEIRCPIIEYTSLFRRAIGEITDVVEKEMYTFEDRNGKSLTLRPEGTAGCVRAGIEHGILYNQEQRLWYIGPMFRYERPQKGRYRQFYQLGVETFGLAGPDIDAELIILSTRWWKALGIIDHIELEINSIGSLESRSKYLNKFVIFLKNNYNILDKDSKRRMYTNPLRILDSKNSDIQKLLSNTSDLFDFLDDESREHFKGLCILLDDAGVKYRINKRLVRGLDYYNRTVFEWVTSNKLESHHSAICGGGRYDGLVEQLGGHKTSAVGLAMGLERLVSLVQEVNPDLKLNNIIDVYIVVLGWKAQSTAMQLAEKIRDNNSKLKLITNFGGGTCKKQFARANKLGARIVLILGEEEIEKRQVIIKDLRTGHQQILDQDKTITVLKKII